MALGRFETSVALSPASINSPSISPLVCSQKHSRSSENSNSNSSCDFQQQQQPQLAICKIREVVSSSQAIFSCSILNTQPLETSDASENSDTLENPVQDEPSELIFSSETTENITKRDDEIINFSKEELKARRFKRCQSDIFLVIPISKISNEIRTFYINNKYDKLLESDKPKEQKLMNGSCYNHDAFVARHKKLSMNSDRVTTHLQGI